MERIETAILITGKQDTGVKTSISIAELGAGVAPTSTKLFSGIATQTTNLLKSEATRRLVRGVGEGKVGGMSTKFQAAAF
jgi:hypothetical protein